MSDLSDMVEIGGKIVVLGNRLEELKTKRAALDSEIQSINNELMPLVAKHSQIIASLSGSVVAPPPVVAVGNPQDPNGQKRKDPTGLERRIMMLMEKADDELSAVQIAEFLGEDVGKVRTVMRQMMDRRREAGGEMEVATDK